MRKLLLLLAFANLPIAGFCPQNNDKPTKDRLIFTLKKQIFEKTIYDKPFTPELLKEAIYFAEIKSPGIVYRQALLETGGFKSDLFQQANNCFGMRLAKVRQTTATGTYKYHAKYKHWYYSVLDYRLLQDWYENAGHSLKDYYAFLKTIRYATDKRYINKLKSIV